MANNEMKWLAWNVEIEHIFSKNCTANNKALQTKICLSNYHNFVYIFQQAGFRLSKFHCGTQSQTSKETWIKCRLHCNQKRNKTTITNATGSKNKWRCGQKPTVVKNKNRVKYTQAMLDKCRNILNGLPVTQKWAKNHEAVFKSWDNFWCFCTLQKQFTLHINKMI